MVETAAVDRQVTERSSDLDVVGRRSPGGWCPRSHVGRVGFDGFLEVLEGRDLLEDVEGGCEAVGVRAGR